MRLSFSAFVLLISGGLLTAPGCDNTPDVGPLRDGKAECLELGELCHDAEELGGRYAECHRLGHVNDGAACLKDYEECKALCEAVEHGHGGAGGESGAAAH